jgi:hypothetical protein
MGDPPKKLVSIAYTVATTDVNNALSFAVRLVLEKFFFFILPPFVRFKDLTVPQWCNPMVNMVSNTIPAT